MCLTCVCTCLTCVSVYSVCLTHPRARGREGGPHFGRRFGEFRTQGLGGDEGAQFWKTFGRIQNPRARRGGEGPNFGRRFGDCFARPLQCRAAVLCSVQMKVQHLLQPKKVPGSFCVSHQKLEVYVYIATGDNSSCPSERLSVTVLCCVLVSCLCVVCLCGACASCVSLLGSPCTFTDR